MTKMWECSIFVADGDIPNGADSPPRQAAIDAMEQLGLTIESCTSGWGGEDFTPKIAQLKQLLAHKEEENLELRKQQHELIDILSSVVLNPCVDSVKIALDYIEELKKVG